MKTDIGSVSSGRAQDEQDSRRRPASSSAAPQGTQPGPVAWRLKHKPVFGIDLRYSFGEFFATSEATVREYVAKGWTAVPLYERAAPQDGES